MSQNELLHDAIAAGRAAYSMGVQVLACPHGPGNVDPRQCHSAEHYGWLFGWWQAFMGGLSDEQRQALDEALADDEPVRLH